MKVLNKIIIFLGVVSFVFSGDTFARKHVKEEGKRAISVKRSTTKQPSRLNAKKDSRRTAIRKEPRRTAVRKTSRRTANTYTPEQLSVLQEVRGTRRKGLPRVVNGYYDGGKLSQRVSKYYEDLGYIPGKTGTFTMTGAGLIGGVQQVRESVPEFDEHGLTKSYNVSHEKVTEMLNNLLRVESIAKTVRPRLKKVSHRSKRHRA